MPINYPVPFYSNTPDDTHCFQAAMKMVYEYFKPDEKLSFEEWDKISAKVEGLYTWQMAGLLWMAKDFHVTDIRTYFQQENTDFPIPVFTEDGSGQLKLAV